MAMKMQVSRPRLKQSNSRKPAVNIPKLTGGKNEKFRWGVLRRKLQLDLYFVHGKTLNGKKNNWICDMSKGGFLIEILLRK